MQILECQLWRNSPYRASMAQTITGGYTKVDPGDIGFADVVDINCEANSLVFMHAFCTLLGEWCPHKPFDGTYTFTMNCKVIAPKREWCPTGLRS